ncbi:MAG: phosphoribosylformylglycinamidine synthase [Clostridia bacterium]|nr:phosphoribosylformylglycinamidine synthase [Clostridia bacterium]
MVFRAYTEKKPGLSPEAERLKRELREFLGLRALEQVRILNRYDLEGIDEPVYDRVRTAVLAEPQVDFVWDEQYPDPGNGWHTLAVEALPGQFDQRADSLAQCVAMLTGGERPETASAKVYLLQGDLTEVDLEAARSHLINPVESREASSEKPETLRQELTPAPMVATLTGFTAFDGRGLEDVRRELGLAMDSADLAFLQAYFRDEEHRDPTITEVRVVDTYWSDHCRHTTFGTHLGDPEIEEPEVSRAWEEYLQARSEVYGDDANSRPVTLMDMATLGSKLLKKRGLLPELDESEEVNACSIHVPAVVNGAEQDWLLMFKNETHNHPTEIEPFGGAATCIGGCIRDPLSGRAYVHQAMRVTGCGDPRAPFAGTLKGKLPQRRIAQTAAEGYSSYGNQIGLATGHVAEVYHPGYIAKHLETGAVVGAVRSDAVRRERPEPGDVVILLGGRTGRDGIGGATGSSKTHDLTSLSSMASEVQKGNAPEERKLQRLFRNPEAAGMIKRCNDFGAGGVAVAVGELADGLVIDLDAVRKKYEGLDGTELAISESQERMAVVVAPGDVERFTEAAARENVEAYPVASVQAEPRMVMKWQGRTVLDLSRAFLNTNGAVRQAGVRVPARGSEPSSLPSSLREAASDLAFASRRGLTERFDSTVGAGSVLMPFGGRSQRTPAQVMAALLPVAPDETTSQASLMSWAFDPAVMSANPYQGAFESVEVSLAKLVAAGGDWKKAYLTMQEFFGRPGEDPERWGLPFAALLGALVAQLQYGRPAIGGKDSMSGSFLDLDVPPTLISFAVTPIDAKAVLSPEFKTAGSPVYLFGSDGNREAAWDAMLALAAEGRVRAAWAVERTPAEGIINMSFGNGIGFESDMQDLLWKAAAGTIVAELTAPVDIPEAQQIGTTTSAARIRIGSDEEQVSNLLSLSEAVLADVYPTQTEGGEALQIQPVPSATPVYHGPALARPRVVIPVFPGTNCEYDSARACIAGGLDPQILVMRTLTPADLSASVEELEKLIQQAQIVFLPGGFSGGDEPEGSAKFIVSLLRNPRVSDAVHDLLKNRDGLMLGICNGFQALIKTGLVPYGEIRQPDETSPTLTANTIGRHQSMIVRTAVVNCRSPWLLGTKPGEVYSVPVSHGEGRFLASPEVLTALAQNGQIATQYVDEDGRPSMDTDWNPNGSVWAVEGITSPDGRIFGKMGHSERIGENLYRNVAGSYDMGLFRSAVQYFA